YHQTNQKTNTGKTLKPWPILVDHYTGIVSISISYLLINSPQPTEWTVISCLVIYPPQAAEVHRIYHNAINLCIIQSPQRK
ncbi:hypothetical protein ABN069_21335, partial [Providencia rettgeri]